MGVNGVAHGAKHRESYGIISICNNVSGNLLMKREMLSAFENYQYKPRNIVYLKAMKYAISN
jgi:hypothetical protein